MLIKDLHKQTIAIWGTGSEGQAAKEYLEKHKIAKHIITYNDDEGEGKFAKILATANVIIRSPGVSIYKPEFTRIKEAEIAVTSCSDLFLSEMRANHPHTKVIGITGSKGKSTSASMLYHMLRRMGKKTALGGNIGKPLVELLDEENDYVVCELSSYQASDLSVSPNIVLFTNLFSVHTDWHGGHNNYCKDKVHLAAHQKNGDICIINANNAALKEYCKALANKVYYGEKDGFHANGKDLFYADEKIISIDELKISGNHNIDNLAGVMAIVKHLGLDYRAAIEHLKDFEPLPHRLQNVGTIDNVTFINDSISTAPEAAIGAMQSFDCDIVIISGGIENHQDYQQYAMFIENNPKVKMAVSLYQCGPQIASDIRRIVKRPGFKLIEPQTLEDGVYAAYQELKGKGGLVLFSPTAPSFGFYKNFMERGEHFINIVKKLAK